MKQCLPHYDSALLFVSCAAAALLVPAAHAQDSARSQPAAMAISLPSLALGDAADRIGRHFAVAIVIEGVDGRAVITRPVRNVTTLDAALKEALSGLGVAFHRRDDGTIVIGSGGGTGDIVVIATRDEAETNLNVNSANSSTRTGKSLREQPRSTSVVTARLIQEQQLQTINDALRNVSGVIASSNSTGLPSFQVRGFQAQTISNGLNSSLLPQPVAGLERIEVLKGPDAILAGVGNFGGVVNLVTKRPSALPLLDIAVEAGRFGDRKITVDGSTAISPDKRFSARLTLEAAGADRTYMNFRGREEYLIAPVFRFKDADTDVVIGASGSRAIADRGAYTSFLTEVPGTPLAPQRRQPFGPRGQGITAESQRYYVSATHRVNSWLTLVARGEHTNNTLRFNVYSPIFATDETTYLFGAQRDGRNTMGNAADAYARVNVSTGPMKHTLTGGYNHSDSTSDILNPTQSVGPFLIDLFTGSGADFDDNVYAGSADFPNRRAGLAYSSTARLAQDGFYLQDFIELGPVKAIAGVRRNRYFQRVTTPDAPPEFQDVRFVKSAVTPSFGVILDVVRHVSLYANYLRGYDPGGVNNTPNSGVPGAFDGLILPDVTSTNIEGGVKLDPFGGKLSIVASAFRIKQNNSAIGNADGNATFVLPAQTSKGFEFDMNGRILPGWDVSATFTHTQYEQNVAIVPRSVATPKTEYSLYTSYQVQRGTLKGLAGSIGLFGTSSSFASFDEIEDLPNGVPVVPARRQVDVNLRYRVGGWLLNAGVKNVFDRRNYLPATYPGFVPLGDPRVWRVTASYSFF